MPPDNASASQTAASGHGVAYRIVRAMFVVLFFWVFWKLGGLLLNAIVGRLYQSGAESDAYFFAAQTVVYGLIFGYTLKVLLPAFTPVFIEEKNERGERAAWDLASTVLNLTLAACAVMMVVMYVYAKPITDTLVPGFDPAARALGIRLLRWILPGAALMVLFLPVRAILNSYKVFSYPSAAEGMQKVLWALGMLAAYRFLHIGIWAVALGFVVGSAGMLAVSLFGLRGRAGLYRLGFPGVGSGRLLWEALIAGAFLLGTIACLYMVGRTLPEGFRYRGLTHMTIVLAAVVAYSGQLWLRARNHGGATARLAALCAPLIASTVFAAYRDVMTLYFQSYTSQGVFSDIEYAKRIAFVPTTVVASALSVAMFPYLCELAGRRDHSLLAGVIAKAMRMLALGFVPLTVLTVVLADPVCRLVLDPGDWAAVHLRYTSLAVIFLALGLTIYAWEFVIMQAYYSLQRMWAPSLIGVIATLFQLAFLAVPIRVLGFDYPVQIFFLVALALPVSRYFKNLILLALLKREMPILRARETLAFAAKLAALSAAVGLAAWLALGRVQRALPLEPYRQHKVVVDNFEAGTDTWFSLNAEQVEIAADPTGGQGAAVMMSYRRGGRAECSLSRELGGLRLEGPVRLDFKACATGRAVPRLVVQAESADKRTAAGTFAPVWTAPPGWQEFSCTIPDAAGIKRLYWLDGGGGQAGRASLFLKDVQLTDERTGELIWREDFQTNGWTGGPAGTAPRIVDAAEPGKPARCGLLVEPDTLARKDLSRLDPGDADHFRCRLMSRSAGAGAKLTLQAAGGKGSLDVALPVPGVWEVVDASWEKMGFKSAADFRSLRAIEVQAAGASVYVDDVTLRRPATRFYEAAKLVHCAVPTLLALIVGLPVLLALRFPETRDVVEWVRRRGWRRRKEIGGEDGSGGIEA